MPVMAPMKWDADGWPTVQLTTNSRDVSYSLPRILGTPHALKPLTGVDRFEGTELGPEWEWNHNPDNTRWSLNKGLILKTATVTDDLCSARNTLTHRILGPS